MPTPSDLNFTRRMGPDETAEWMDEPCAYETFRDCVRSLGDSNRWTFANLPTLLFLDRAAKAKPQGESPLRVLDVGSGGGDTLRTIARWAARQALAVELTGIDLNPHATRAARELSGNDPRYAAIQWRTGSVYDEPGENSIDLVISSQVTHHMRDREIVAFLRWMEANARRGWFINDILRSARSYAFYQVFSQAMRFHPYVRHDGLLSIRRGFRRDDWQRLLAEGGMPASAVRITQPVPGRICAARLR